MSNKTRSVIKLVAILIVLLCVLIEASFVSIPLLNPYRFWLVVISFGLILIASK